jgi:nucleoside-diphosphate-sugar epimerase
MNKRILVCGAGGFIGGHLVNRLKKEGYWVRGVDLKNNEYSATRADEFIIGDLRDFNVCKEHPVCFQFLFWGDFS